jgi:hypothetical protein
MDTNGELLEEEIARRRDDAICRALNTPPKPLKESVGKSERDQAKRKSGLVRKSDRSTQGKAWTVVVMSSA